MLGCIFGVFSWFAFMVKVKLLKSCVWFLPSSCVGVFPPPSFMFSLLSSSSIFLFYVSAYLFLSARPNPPFSPALPDLRQSKVLVSVSVSSPDLFHVVLRYANRVGSDVLGRVSVIEDGRWSYYCGNCECWMGLFFFFFFSHPSIARSSVGKERTLSHSLNSSSPSLLVCGGWWL